MKRNIIFTLLILVLSLSISLAQGSKSVARKIKNLEAKGHYVEAAQLHIIQHDAGEREGSINAAMNLYKIGKFKDALYYFQHADSIGTLDRADEIYGYFESLKAAKKYKEADALINTHLAKAKGAPELEMNANRELYYQKLMGYGKTRISRLGINSNFSEFGPTVLDGWLYFESTRPAKDNQKLHGLNNQPFFNLYAHAIGDPSNAVVAPQGSFGSPQVTISSGGKQTLSVPADINKSQHDGPVYLTPDGKHLFYTTNWDHEGKPDFKNPYLNLSYSYNALENSQIKEVGKIHLNIYYSTRESNMWSNPIPFPYNNDQWSNQHPYFDGKSGTLYFSSNMPGGMGGFDIWKSTLKGNNWSKPENLGPFVNSTKNEVFPTLSPEGLLIFSSNGWPGLGGLDLFVSEFPEIEPINLLGGLNTEMDDFGMTFTKKGVGYFVSNRKESQGDDDIFEFEMNVDDIIEYIRPSFEIVLVNGVTGEKLIGTVAITQRGAKRTLQVGATGTSFRMSAPSADFEALVDGYFPAKTTLKASENKGQIVLTLQPIQAPKPEPVVINVVPIYFDYDKFNIRKDASADLDKLVETLNSNPTLTLEASAHTDCRGTLDYNQNLSEKRLKSTLEYLRKRIVNPERLSGISLGESRPVNPCDCETPPSAKCKEDIHQANRRTEFIVVKY